MNFTLPLRGQPLILRSMIALLPTLFSFFGRDFLPPIVNQTPAALHYPVVLFATWIGGFLPGFISTVLCTGYSIVVLRPHLLSEPLSDLPSLVRSIMFFTTCLLFLWLISGLQRALGRASRAIEIRDEFMSIASHELKTPLASVMLRTQVRQRALKQNYPDLTSPSRIAADLDQDLKNLLQLNALVSDMLDISRIEKGALPLSRQAFDLRDLIKEATDRHSALTEAEGIRLDVRLADEPIVGNWDKFRIEQVYTNLLINAFRYGRKSPVSVTVAKVDGEAVIEVQDRGLGIGKKDQARIFRKFERATNPSEVSGLGLGLYIANNIVAAHGGRIAVESEPGQGATFAVRLPI